MYSRINYKGKKRPRLKMKKQTYRYKPDKPYNDLPLLPPKVKIETVAILKKLLQPEEHYQN